MELSISVDSHNILRKKRLQQLILRKRKQVTVKSKQYGLLKDELELIKREYLLRVGSLFSRDNHLDIEIIKYKNILEFIRGGLTLEEAMVKVESEYYSEDFGDQTDFESRPDGEFMTEHGRETSGEEQQLKSLWKKAVMKFHPDLVSDQKEKKVRENIMKQINKAYNERDFKALNDLYKNNEVKGWHETTIEELEQLLIEIENNLISIKNEFQLLKKTEWYQWKKKIIEAKKDGIDVFKELEDSMFDDIVRKTRILTDLKIAVGEF